jgi:maltose alpha-D-glucosyltransferase/alpha-amylase
MSTLWHKDAIIYQVYVRGFYDANGDGVGDFVGLTEKLDHIRELGCNTILLLPFYPSPLRDDGYDISDYKGVHPAYGTLEEFRRFLDAAHDAGLRVVAELVINHTSDEHPWFRAARGAPDGEHGDFYVWSDDDRRYPDARVLFVDSEKSNWEYDAARRQFYLHRFHAFEPDLNYDNPRVVAAMLDAVRYWFDQGVDGLVLAGAPYLVERDGTPCEGLPETHAVLRRFRAELDAGYPGRVLVAEANQWPEDVVPYFGSGRDECHMAFNFPLMPRLFMALRREERAPIVEILERTPPIPDDCQWGLFLRNHTELTLEMVTDHERDYLFAAYARDARMRLNRGIRRRLAPLMEHDRRRIELLNALLLSMRGSPVIYYGDEIGMGDNVYLGGRAGVRTPMQWTGDRNAGFSGADPARLYFPLNMDPVYGYQAVNVEAQQRTPASLLNWMRRLIAVRRRTPAFGRGSRQTLAVDNPAVFAFTREDAGTRIVVVANLSARAQQCGVDLAQFAGAVPVEMLGESTFRPIDAGPYMLTLAAYGFYWLQLGAPPAG